MRNVYLMKIVSRASPHVVRKISLYLHRLDFQVSLSVQKVKIS